MIAATFNHPDQDRRKCLRIPMGILIHIPHLKLKLLCHDLSTKGCFFQKTDLGPVGQTFSILIDPPEIGMIPVEARVAHKGDDGKGSGVQFMSMAPKDGIKLADFLEIFES